MELSDNKPKVLYVDDEDNNLLVFKSSFRRFYQVQTALSANDANEYLKNHAVDIVISDQRMPDMSGVEFLKGLPDELISARMIMTGYSDIEAVIDALNNGKIDKYIKKPWNKEELKNIIDEAYDKLNKQHANTDISKPILNANSLNFVEPKQDQQILPKEERVLNLENEVKDLSKKIQDAYKNIQLLSEIGQEITSTLNLETILNTVYENVNQLMDASVFGIGIYNPESDSIDYRLAIENGKRYQPYSRTMVDKNQFPVWCIENRKEVFINNVNIEYQNYIQNFKEISSPLEDGSESDIAESYIYMPLLINERVIGLISVQSFKKNAYNNYHLSALRNIAIFVATAIENSKAYSLIEKQKTEIEQKNIELEHKVEKRTEELKIQKDELEETFSKLKLLTEIGQEITSSLNLDKILTTIYENVNRLMDASVFGIGIYSSQEKLINYQLAIENGKRYQPYTRTMDDKNQLPVWCIEHKKEVFINDVNKEFQNYIKGNVKINLDDATLEDGTIAEVPTSLIYMPLLFNNNPIGVLTVQSFRRYAYNQYHLDILRSLGSYITTAIQNAHSYNKMTEAFEQLKSTQSKLVEAEKMASLGVLTAGVAHEINNPVNFISAGVDSLNDNFLELKNVLHKINNRELIKNAEEQLVYINNCIKELELEVLLPEMEDLIGSIKNGATRTTEIVKGLRNFTRLDEDDKKIANLEEGIDNTLVILNNRTKDRIKVIKEYGKLPPIMCFPGQLNQVFMNIIFNATDAIKDKGEIKIKTWVENNTIFISIKDSGSGMPEEVRSKIFEPFFTTKAVGEGTGLGLSISYGIIEKHNGNIEVNSTIGKGTEFIITLPIKELK